MEYTFGGKYLLGSEVAVGGCGTVYQGVHKVAGKEVAIKVEPALAKSSPLQQETKIYRSLQGGPGVPWMMWAGRAGEYNVMVIDLLGPSLEDLFQTCNRYFSLKTVLMLGVQLVRLLASCMYSHSWNGSSTALNTFTRAGSSTATSSPRTLSCPRATRPSRA